VFVNGCRQTVFSALNFIVGVGAQMVK
jgi:hypothetical protein